MKIAINKCHGGFGLSAKAMKHYYGLKGRECYFFLGGIREEKKEISLEEADRELFVNAFSVRDPKNVASPSNWLEMSLEERRKWNEEYRAISLDSRPENRSDPDLIATIEALGDEASGRFSKLVVVEIPEGIEYEIEEYGGLEWIAEKHRTWS